MCDKISLTIETEVLVAGGAGAGVMAAIHAARGGAAVVLVSKGKIGRSGNVIMAGGGCGIDGQSGKDILGIKSADPSFTRENLYDCIVKESFYLAEQNMVKQYVEDAPTALQDYLRWADRAHCKFVPIQPCGWQSSGLQFARPLVEGMKEAPEVQTMEDTIVLDLLMSEKRVTGALCLNFYTGELIQVNAKAVILATGGYQPRTLNNTVSDMTGDGQAMAYRAGATLSDMEFMLAFPTALVPEDMRGSIYPYIFRRIPHRLTDKNGDEIVIPESVRRLSSESKLNKIVNCYYMGHAVANGLGGPHGGVFWDYSRASEEEKRKGFDQFYHRFSLWHKYGYYKGESMKRVEEMIFRDESLEVGLGIEYSMGGVAVNERMETGIDGLLAAGEVTAGTFGACRVGDGLIEMLAHGMKAGQVAAEYCRAHDWLPSDPEQVNRLAEETLSFFDNADGPNAIQVYNRMEKICDRGLGVIRDEAGIQGALDELLQVKQEAKKLTLACRSRKYNFEWLRAIQVQNMLVCDEAALRAALERRESRGCHIRKDYEQVDHDHYLHHYQFQLKEGAMNMSAKAPTLLRPEVPHGRADNILSYFTDPRLNYSRSFKISFD